MVYFFREWDSLKLEGHSPRELNAVHEHLFQFTLPVGSNKTEPGCCFIIIFVPFCCVVTYGGNESELKKSERVPVLPLSPEKLPGCSEHTAYHIKSHL